MNDRDKTTEELRQELMQKLQRENAQYLQEIAMPGIVQNVDTKKI